MQKAALELVSSHWIGAERVRITRRSRVLPEAEVKEEFTAVFQRACVTEKGKLKGKVQDEQKALVSLQAGRVENCGRPPGVDGAGGLAFAGGAGWPTMDGRTVPLDGDRQVGRQFERHPACAVAAELSRRYEAVLRRRILRDIRKTVFKSNLMPESLAGDICQEMASTRSAEAKKQSGSSGVPRLLGAETIRRKGETGGRQAPRSHEH